MRAEEDGGSAFLRPPIVRDLLDVVDQGEHLPLRIDFEFAGGVASGILKPRGRGAHGPHTDLALRNFIST